MLVAAPVSSTNTNTLPVTVFYDNFARYVSGRELRNVVDLTHGY